MTRDERIEAIFDEAMSAPSRERAAVLERLCAGDAGLRAEVESLLSHAQETRDFLESPLFPGAGLDNPMPESIGAFKVLRLLGEGGMGRVYEAQQERPRRVVAIKVVRPDAMSAAALRRFDREIETLGQLRHPGIAQLYEVGQHAQAGGRPLPYLVMELVRGTALTKFAAAERLSVAERVGLLAEIADAVQYAHQRGVVHRDLKPENILIEKAADGRLAVKILDFGIARLTDGSGDALHTMVGQPMGTPAYMSPEQFAADPAGIDTRCDVYALGVIGYELFAGARPFDTTGMSLVQAARLIEATEPPALGTVDKALRGDVETIVAKAMAKDRERRYPTGAALAEDLRRHLRDEPILARPPSAAYQFSRFARRHRGLVGASVLAVLALVAGVVVSTVLYVREQGARKREAEQAALSGAVREYMISGLLMAAAPDRMGWDVKMMDVLARASDGLHERFADHPEVEGAVRLDLGAVLGQLGKYKESEEQLRLAIPLLERTAGREGAATVSAMNKLANALMSQQRSAEALGIATEALSRARKGLPIAGEQSISARNNTGAALQVLGRVDEAMEVLREGLALAERDPQQNKDVLASILTQMAACEIAQGRMEAALEINRRLVAHSVKEMGPDSEMAIVSRSNLINALSNAGKSEEAASVAEGLPESAERTLAPGHPSRGYVYLSSADALMATGQFARAEGLLLKAYDVFSAASGELGWPTEQAMEAIRRLYARWPGHGEKLPEWCVKGARVRMMMANLDERKTTLRTIQIMGSQCMRAKVDFGQDGLLGTIWNRRDELAPPKHPRRAAMLANFALVCAAVGETQLVKPLAEMAEAALADATEQPEVAKALVEAAKGEGERVEGGQ